MTTSPTDEIIVVFSGPLQINGVTTAGARMFAVSRGDARSTAAEASPQVVEIIDGEPAPFPDGAWSSWTVGEDVQRRFVGSTRSGSDQTGPCGSSTAVRSEW